MCNHINVGYGKDISIKELAKLIKDVVGYEGTLKFDESKPDGNPRKLLDSSKLFNLGWRPQTELSTGIAKTYKWYRKNIKN